MHHRSEKSTRRHPPTLPRCFLPSIALALPLFFGPQLAAQNASHTDPTEHIRGVVINSVTHEPISRVLVFSPDNAFAAMTDDRGRFEFTFTPAASQPAMAFDIGGPQQNGFQNPTPNRPNALMARKVGFVGSNFEQPNKIQPISSSSTS